MDVTVTGLEMVTVTRLERYQPLNQPRKTTAKTNGRTKSMLLLLLLLLAGR